MSVNIQLEWTPNPSTLKYVVDRRLLASGAVNITSKQAAEEKSPLAVKLMGIKGVMAVMVGSNFVTVSKGDEGEWDELNDAVMATLDEHLGAGLPAVNEEALAATRAAAGVGGSVEARIQDILDAEIRPAVAQDGGDITLDRFEEGIVYLHMKGACSGCPSSTATLKMGIESRLRELIPEVSEVVSV
ncbi:NifU family protein [Archangium sp.]|jgi:Fe-S cluster biogenesis protein NfuA|uniref:NifU family protein n=1 Tax=Archangium sp. TaxID=1872627 RepID=UPI002ED93664